MNDFKNQALNWQKGNYKEFEVIIPSHTKLDNSLNIYE